MWVFTTDGFFSAVVHRADPEVVIVRARVKHDLIHFRQKIRDNDLVISTDWEADYPFRVVCPRSKWVHYLHVVAETMDYDNFKNANRDRSSVYHDVWAVLHDLERFNGYGILRDRNADPSGVSDVHE